MSKEKLTTVEVAVPYKSPGNVIIQKPVKFDVYSRDGSFEAIPALSDDERRIANLPSSLAFIFDHSKVVSKRGTVDGNFHVIQDIVTEMKRQKVIE